MPTFPHDRDHILIDNRAIREGYVGRGGGRKHPIPIRDRERHARRLEAELREALSLAQRAATLEVRRAPNDIPGYYLTFALSAQGQEFLQRLENRQQGIELLAVKSDEQRAIQATVFVPFGAEDFFRKRIETYRTEDTAKGKPRNEPLVANIDAVALATVASIFTDANDRLPADDAQIWWEAWLRKDTLQAFIDASAVVGATVKQTQRVTFPEREVVLVHASVSQLARLMTSSDAIAELRTASDNPATFLGFRNFEQAEWVRNLTERVRHPDPNAPAVCILDSGITRTHQLLAGSIRTTDVHSYDPNWGTGDSAVWQGHGSAMAGIVLYGDIQQRLLEHGPVTLRHRLESVKMLDPSGVQHDPNLYGAVTQECVARPEIEAPNIRRAFCMAVTSDSAAPGGRPSSWSAKLDALAYETGGRGRLIVVSAGNIAREDIDPARYPDQVDEEPIHSPAQAWNVLTVGAFTEKTTIADPDFRGWHPVAPLGEISPASRTSVLWQRQWPVKPDVVSEGGNWASDGTRIDSPEDLAILTTHHVPMVQQFTTIRDTSAATASVSEIGGRILAARAEFWPETVRGLLVHSANWTGRMQDRMRNATTQAQRVAVLRRYGYGVPDYTRALFSSINDVTLVAQDEIQPFRRGNGHNIVGNQMCLHRLPWPTAELRALGATEVEVRVTLSYFIEPNPGERGWNRRHRYASHGLRFAMKRSLESLEVFRSRINKAVQLEEENIANDAGPDNWLIGSPRNVGSLHSDYWRGTAIELAGRDAIAVYPVTGWWKEKPQLDRYQRSVRYALTVSINSTNAAVDIYTPIEIAVGIPVRIA